ncbi:MAG TPA: translation initiation factor IF-2 N-terminal domain-containing protein, partial [Thermoleophilaceae bacterium]
MAKRRVHEIAKERGISSKEVIAILQKAGLDVKTAAQSVDEGDIARAFDPNAGKNGAGAKGDGANGRAAGGQAGAAGDGQSRPQRPTRAAPPNAAGPGGRRRRVVI